MGLAELIEYLEEHQNSSGSKTDDNKLHASLKERVRSNPTAFEVHGEVTHVFEEVDVGLTLRQAGTSHGTILDLILITDAGEVYLFEMKTTLKAKNARKLPRYRQLQVRGTLRRAYEQFKERYGVFPHMVTVHQSKRSSNITHTYIPRPISDLL